MSNKILERADVKAAVVADPVDAEKSQRTIEFYALAFSEMPDRQGDRVDRHALDGWLAEFYKAGVPLPISYAHAALLNSGRDPFDIVGYAPADEEHVRLDDYGLRISGFLETGTNEKARHVFALAKAGVLRGASVAFEIPQGGEKRQKDGSTLITEMWVREAGPCIEGANPDAYVISVKAVDGGDWDGGRAMGLCSSAADFARIAFRRTGDSDPDTAAAWALPHHMGPAQADSPNAKGVAAALGALNGARGGAPELRDAAAARSHLEDHARAIEGAKALEEVETRTTDYSVTYTVKHAGGPSYLQSIHDLAIRGGAKCSTDEVSAKADEEAAAVRVAKDEEARERTERSDATASAVREWMKARSSEDNDKDGETRTSDDPELTAAEVRRWLADR